jgi:hypothetical protein
MMPLSLRCIRFARTATKRSKTWKITARGFFSTAGIGSRRACGDVFSGDIFSNVKAGIVYPLIVELKHVRKFSRTRQVNCLRQQTVPFRFMQMHLFKHNLCQIEAIGVRIADCAPQIQNFFRSD